MTTIYGYYDKMSIDMDIEFFSNWLIDEMQERGWSQSDLARSSGLSRQAISNYVNRKIITPDENALKAIANALKLTPETVFRAAGLLPPKPEEEVTLEEWRYVLSQLTDEDREELLNIARLKIERRENKQKQTAAHRKAEGLV